MYIAATQPTLRLINVDGLGWNPFANKKTLKNLSHYVEKVTQTAPTVLPSRGE